MNAVMKDREPISVWKHFEAISRIPRGSKNEAEVAGYIEAFARERGLFCIRDEHNNVFVRKPAAPGYEDAEPVLLQGHTDMVCEKNGDTVHDFEKDPIELRVDGDYLRANGTTLGADDGIAVALMLALLEEEHPAPELECLFTADEEMGMSGAENFDYSVIRAKNLVNLDSEEENIAVVSCAGGVRVDFDFDYPRVKASPACSLVAIDITGLAGGHSGADINLGRTNAVVLMGNLLSDIYCEAPFNLLSFDGGSKDNAIPRECRAVISVRDRKAVLEQVKKYAVDIKSTVTPADKGLKIRAKNISCEGDVLSFGDTSRIINAILLSPNGVLHVSPHDPSFPDASSNIGRLHVDENGGEMHLLARASADRKLDELVICYERLGAMLEAGVNAHSRYPGWEYSDAEELRQKYSAAVKAVFGETTEAEFSSIHAGLECGIILSRLPHKANAISIGPSMHDIHTPDERLDIGSTERFWRVLLELLRSMK